MSRAIITVGLGFGDEGKGSTVDFLCREYNADLVVRYCGGPQCGHNVVLPDGRRHTFAQFGSGTLAGVPTYLGRHVIIDPLAMRREAQHLVEIGVSDPYRLLHLSDRCLVATRYHRTLGRLRELARESSGQGRHGTCGFGVGETRRYWLEHGMEAIFAWDLTDHSELCDKLELLRHRCRLEAQQVWTCDTVLSAEAFPWVADLDLSPSEVADELQGAFGEDVRRWGRPLAETIVFEGAQGVLLDEMWGFHPHTTWSDVTQRHALEMIREWEIDYVSTVGILRAFLTRHGEGPLPTYDEALTAELVDEGNPENLWQGKIRVGWQDLGLLKYAAQVAGGPIDGLAVTWLDWARRLDHSGRFKVGCTPTWFVPRYTNLKYQEWIGACLKSQLAACLCSCSVEEFLRRMEEIAPVVISSDGPTSGNRRGLPLQFREVSA